MKYFKLLLISAVLLLSLSSAVHALAMSSTDNMAQDGMAALTHKSSTSDCVNLCVTKAHDMSVAAIKSSVQDVLLFLLSILIVVGLFKVVVQIRHFVNNQSLARPPDLITLYAHYLI